MCICCKIILSHMTAAVPQTFMVGVDENTGFYAPLLLDESLNCYFSDMLFVSRYYGAA